jgi:hypothetical protein
MPALAAVAADLLDIIRCFSEGKARRLEYVRTFSKREAPGGRDVRPPQASGAT